MTHRNSFSFGCILVITFFATCPLFDGFVKTRKSDGIVKRTCKTCESLGRYYKPYEAWDCFTRGVELAHVGNYKLALFNLERARVLCPNWALPYLEIAVVHLKSDNNCAAIGRSIAKAVELGPELPRAHYLYGVYLQQRHEYKAAIHHFTQALERRPGMVNARFQRAMLYVEQGKVNKGRKEYQRVIKQQPSHIGAHRNLAALYEKAHEFDLAEHHLLSIFRWHPNNAYHLFKLANFYKRIGQKDKARAAFNKAASLDPVLPSKRNMRALPNSQK